MALLFTPGAVFITPGVQSLLWENPGLPQQLVDRHVAGDWSEMAPEDQKANQEALVSGARIFSRYIVLKDVRLWVITEAKDAEGKRPYTTVLLPLEY